MAGIRALRQIEIGLEAVAGTAHAGTHIWRGTGSLKDLAVPKLVKEDVGYLHSLGRSYIPALGAEIKFAPAPATYQYLPWIFTAGVEQVESGVADGAGTGEIYQFDGPSTSANAISSFTIRGGDNQRVDVAEYAFVKNWQLTGAAGEAVMLSATLEGRQATDGDYTGSLTPAAVNEVLFGNGVLSLDASSGTVGTTPVVGAWVGFKFGGPTGWQALRSGEGDLFFATPIFTGNVEKPMGGEISLLHGTVAEAEIAIARTKDATRLMRMLFRGPALTTQGTAYTYYTLQIDAAIRYTDIPELDEDDGNDVVTLPFEVVYNITKTLSYQIIVVNQTAAIT